MSVPTRSEVYNQLCEHITKAQECAAMLAHLDNANDDRQSAMDWLVISELFKKMLNKVIALATRRMQ